jgi:hypothetical protein
MNGFEKEDYEKEEKMRGKTPAWLTVLLTALGFVGAYALYLFLFK